MFDEEKICPYPGLRPFQEEESIFFKGRDEHIRKSSALLEEKKFLMITGASGDGKSSIVYAGLIPYARAGFIQSDYADWAVVAFRPERSPLNNLAASFAEVIDDVDEKSIATNLGRGYSALVDLYKNSSLYVDKSDPEWINADDKGKKKIKRKAANLLIIVDQFEEFFTNAENYHAGQPADEAATLVSTLLETVRIALKDDLPIYIAFTMRSDYIGHCASFRGLPEFIGFSQFFVPRLKRVDLKKAIKEPASLGGVQITDRLIERLLYDLSDGLDQLPILQHTLNRIWNLATVREEPMDLLHYALAGGMDKSELTGEDQKIYNEIATKRGIRRKEVGLKNVLNTHGDELYNETLQKNHSIDTKRGRKIIEIVFKSLSRIDQEKPVRNRMTLEEITNTINRNDISSKDVADIIRVFRQEGNSFLKPYINPEEEEPELSNDTVLDITHESLIRNWVKLKEWAIEEHNHYKVFEELFTLYNHWNKNDRSSSFLLPSGSLNYFEEWYDEAKPNPYWLHKHLKDSENSFTIKDSTQTLDGIRDFLRKSIRKNYLARAVAKYGMLNILSAIGTTVLIISCTFFFIHSRQIQNDAIIQKIYDKGKEIALSGRARPLETSVYLASLVKDDPNHFYELVNAYETPEEQLYALMNTLASIQTGDPDNSSAETKGIIQKANDLLNSLEESTDSARYQKLRQHQLVLTNTSSLYYFSKDEFYNEVGSEIYERMKALIKPILTPARFNEVGLDRIDLINYFSLGIDNGWLTKAEVKDYLKNISPLENEDNSEYSVYSGTKEAYFALLPCYAYLSDIESFDKVISSIQDQNIFGDESLVGYFLVEYSGFIFLKENDKTGFRYFIDKITSIASISKYRATQDLIEVMLRRDVNIAFAGRNTTARLTLTNHVANLNEQAINLFFDEMLAGAQQISDPAESNFEMAMTEKLHGLSLELRYRYNKLKPNYDLLDSVFNRSLKYFEQVDDIYLNKNHKATYYRDGPPTNIPISKKQYYSYPDYLIDIDENWAKLYSPAFFDFLMRTGKAEQFYEETEKLLSFNLWVHNINQRLTLGSPGLLNPLDLDLQLLEKIYMFYKQSGYRTEFFQTSELATLSYAYHLTYASDTTKAIAVLQNLDLEKLGEEYEGNTDYELFLNKIMPEVIKAKGLPESILEFTDNSFQNAGKTMVNLQSLDLVLERNQLDSAFAYIDESFGFFDRYINSNVNVQYGAGSLEYFAVPVLVKLNSNKSLERVKRIVNDSDELNAGRNMKLTAVRKLVDAFARQGDYYMAFKSIPDDASVNNRLNLFRYILDVHFEKTATPEEIEQWKEYDKNFYQGNYVTENF